jgi:hypothetical protein
VKPPVEGPVVELARCFMRAAVDDLMRPHWVFVVKRFGRKRRIVTLTFQKEQRT